MPRAPVLPTINQCVISGRTFKSKAVIYMVDDDGLALVEGCIELGTARRVKALADSRAIVVVGRRWRGGIVPYTVDPRLPNQQRVRDAITAWESVTRVRFVPRTPQHTDYVTFTTKIRNCSSWVGRKGGQQFIRLANGCGVGAVIHEIGHCLGLWHEQSREDRDQFVRVVWENITPGHEANFAQHITDGDDVGRYDYTSNMHYSPTAFSKNGRPTLISRTSHPIRPSSRPTTGDIAAINQIYPGTARQARRRRRRRAA